MVTIHLLTVQETIHWLMRSEHLYLFYEINNSRKKFNRFGYEPRQFLSRAPIRLIA